MKPFPFALLLLTSLHAAELTLTAPLDYEVVQRSAKDRGPLVISGTLSEPIGSAILEARVIRDGEDGKWTKLIWNVSARDTTFSNLISTPAGGWYRVEVRVTNDGKVLAEKAVEHVGVGEVFVIAGQSNSANYGEEKQSTQTGRIATFDGRHWQLSNDPQPGAGGEEGSFMPPFGDEIAKRFDVPVGFIACGIGATSVREWLPKGVAFPNPPTLLGRVQQLPDGGWESKGEAFDMLVIRMGQAGPHGFRAVLWHQGESDANQQDPARTLPGELYRKDLETVIRESRKQIGWDAPWFVAQASYHIPGDESSPEIRDAQASLWKDGIALEGPDSDALKGELRENGGKGVHFTGPGLREHAARWAEKVAPWLDGLLK